MNNKQFSYQKEIGNTVYTVIVRESETAKETVLKKLERARYGTRSKNVIPKEKFYEKTLFGIK